MKKYYAYVAKDVADYFETKSRLRSFNNRTRKEKNNDQ